uniref:Uncharacterized protein n=1 Tax=Setaria digitata TaxID=48799 RepID=A0A915PHX8_9BILA
MLNSAEDFRLLTLFTMESGENVGKAIATAYVKDERDIPDYEFPDSGHVKVSLTISDVAILEGATSESNIGSKSSSTSTSTSTNTKDQIVRIRLHATIAMLISLGFICLLLNYLAWHVVRNAEMKQAFLGILAFLVAVSARDWYHLHGEKLTRALKALLNVSNMLNSFDTFAFDFFGICKSFKLNEKYIFSPAGPKINERIPRTPETRSTNQTMQSEINTVLQLSFLNEPKPQPSDYNFRS